MMPCAVPADLPAAELPAAIDALWAAGERRVLVLTPPGVAALQLDHARWRTTRSEVYAEDEAMRVADVGRWGCVLLARPGGLGWRLTSFPAGEPEPKPRRPDPRSSSPALVTGAALAASIGVGSVAGLLSLPVLCPNGGYSNCQILPIFVGGAAGAAAGMSTAGWLATRHDLPLAPTLAMGSAVAATGTGVLAANPHHVGHWLAATAILGLGVPLAAGVGSGMAPIVWSTDGSGVVVTGVW